MNNQEIQKYSNNNSRQAKVRRRQRRLEDSASYMLVKGAAKYWDNWFIDPIVGLFIPGFGDCITFVVGLPAIWISVIEIRSIPLALAIIYNLLVDSLLGMLPFFVGDIIDAFNKANKKNFELITGFVEDNPGIVKEVNSKAIKTCILIAILCYLIYLMVSFVFWLGEQIGNLWDAFIGLF